MEIKFSRKFQNAATIWSFYFDKPGGLKYQPGDYLELSLPQAGSDGDKRWLSMASSPTEDELFFTTKIDGELSEYKKCLMGMLPGNPATISPPMGTFNLPRMANEKLLFIAAGIGITPYRSMLKFIEDANDHRDIVLVYVARPTEFIFGDVLAAANIPIIQTSDNINFNWIKKRVQDAEERSCYFAGPQPLCEELYNQAQEAGLSRSRLNLDYFEGYEEI